MRKIVLLLIVLTLFSCKPAHDGFGFEKIMYHSGPCFGVCPSYHMEIRNDQSVRLKGDSIYNKRMGNRDYSRAGYFTGKVADSSYRKLIAELRKIGLDTLDFGQQNCCDAPMKTIIVYYNGKRRYLRAMFPPDHAHGLVSALNDIYSKNKFEPTQQRFEIEYDSVPSKKTK
jgi:hypothetical protein